MRASCRKDPEGIRLRCVKRVLHVSHNESISRFSPTKKSSGHNHRFVRRRTSRSPIGTSVQAWVASTGDPHDQESLGVCLQSLWEQECRTDHLGCRRMSRNRKIDDQTQCVVGIRIDGTNIPESFDAGIRSVWHASIITFELRAWITSFRSTVRRMICSWQIGIMNPSANDAIATKQNCTMRGCVRSGIE